MIKTNNPNRIDINVTQKKEVSQIPVHIQRGVGATAVWPRRQDHGTRGNSDHYKKDDKLPDDMTKKGRLERLANKELRDLTPAELKLLADEILQEAGFEDAEQAVTNNNTGHHGEAIHSENDEFDDFALALTEELMGANNDNVPSGQYKHRKHQEMDATLDDELRIDLYR